MVPSVQQYELARWKEVLQPVSCPCMYIPGGVELGVGVGAEWNKRMLDN